MIFRKAQKEDCPFIAEALKDILKIHCSGREDIFRNIGAKYSCEQVEIMLSEQDKLLYVAESNGTLCGYAICKIQHIESDILRPRKVFYLDDLYISKLCRGKGDGKTFMDFLVAEARALCCSSFELNVWEFKGGATEFYKKCGFTTQRRIMEKKI